MSAHLLTNWKHSIHDEEPALGNEGGLFGYMHSKGFNNGQHALIAGNEKRLGM